MMEEMNEEQPEIVTYEEEALADEEAVLNKCVSGITVTTLEHTSSTVIPEQPSLSVTSAAAKAPPSTLATSLSRSTNSSSSHEACTSLPPISVSPTCHCPPGSIQTPYEASSGINFSDALNTDTEKDLMSQGRSLFGWFSKNSFVNKVMEKTKSSVETVITTLDPGMKDIMRSSGNISITVMSDSDSVVAPVREAFQLIFGRVTVVGKVCRSGYCRAGIGRSVEEGLKARRADECRASAAVQPVGFSAGLCAAEDRVNARHGSADADDGSVVVSVQEFIAELFPDKWYELSCLVLRDTTHGICLQTCSQPTFVPLQYVKMAQEQTPDDYPFRSSGLAVTIGQGANHVHPVLYLAVLSPILQEASSYLSTVVEAEQPHIGRADWQRVLAGVSRSESISTAASSLAYMYLHRLPTSFVT